MFAAGKDAHSDTEVPSYVGGIIEAQSSESLWLAAGTDSIDSIDSILSKIHKLPNETETCAFSAYKHGPLFLL